MLDWLKSLFAPMRGLRSAARREPLSDADLQLAISMFRSVICGLKNELPFKRITKVKCPVKFGGWGFVEGQNSGYLVNRRITIVEADDDMDFTEVCVLVDNVPCLLLKERRNKLTVTVITGLDYFEEIFDPSGKQCNTVQDFKQFAEPLQVILREIFESIYAYVKGNREKGDAIETMLNYKR